VRRPQQLLKEIRKVPISARCSSAFASFAHGQPDPGQLLATLFFAVGGVAVMFRKSQSALSVATVRIPLSVRRSPGEEGAPNCENQPFKHQSQSSQLKKKRRRENATKTIVIFWQVESCLGKQGS
jgi:hypothetical protein